MQLKIPGAKHPFPLGLLEREDTPCPALHVYAQPADEGLFAAQRAYAADHPWFSVERLNATSHFPMIEVPHELSARIEAFAARFDAHGTRNERLDRVANASAAARM